MNPGISRNRLGSATLIVLVALIVCTGVLGAHIRSVLQTRRHQVSLHRVHQCDWILRAATERAITEFAADEEYSGDLWELQSPPSCFDEVTVTTTLDNGDPAKLILKVAVEARAGDTVALRRTSHFELRSDSNHPDPTRPKETSS